MAAARTDRLGATRKSTLRAKSAATRHIDSEARLFKKDKFTEAKLRYMTHALSENRNGLIVDVEITEANGRAEWEAPGGCSSVASRSAVPR